MRRSLAVLGLAAALLVASPVASLQRATRFSLGVVRADGVLFPFAHCDNGRWTSPWPVSPRDVDVPITLDAVPSAWWPDDTPEHTWTLWTFDGNARRIEATGPFVTPLYCGAVVELRTSFVPATRPPPLSEQPYPKIGLAATGDVVVEPITIVEAGSDEWKRLETQLVGAFNEAERKARRESWVSNTDFREQVNDAAGMPVTLEAVYRVPHEEPGRVAYFIEASRRYAVRLGGRIQDCDIVTFAWGWAFAEPVFRLNLKLDAYVTSCRREGINVMHPLGLLRLDGRVFWVAQWSGWEEESYAVVEVPRDLDTQVRIQTRVGTCR